RPQDLRVGRHVAEVAQLGADVAGLGELVEHHVPRHRLAEALDRAPGAGRVGHADGRGTEAEGLLRAHAIALPCAPAGSAAPAPTSLTATRRPRSRLSCAASARRSDSTASRGPGSGSLPSRTALTNASSSRR